ncbi:MAG: DUF2851 family protein, partial [Flavobacteriales bacterium]|nr:DUF2851 family protein [Flavobacteriales bacterium]
RLLARNFGLKSNADAMEMLAETVSLQVLNRHRSDPFQIEALLFGQAGFLGETFSDAYPDRLAREFRFLQSKYSLKVLPPAAWNFGRIRPQNFPTVRIAQLAALVCKSEHLFSDLLEANDIASISTCLHAVPNVYWNDHVRFDTPVSGRLQVHERAMGKAGIENMLINTVSIALFTYGRERSESTMDKAMRVLESCGPESNAIVENWKKCGMVIKNALDTQAVLQLYNYYCTEKKCLHCQAGVYLLRN